MTDTMKEGELRRFATCSMCGKPIGHTGVPLFSRVTIERFGVDLNAVQRQQGLGLMIGAHLAMYMGPDDVMARRIGDPVVLSICETCALQQTMVHMLAGMPGVEDGK